MKRQSSERAFVHPHLFLTLGTSRPRAAERNVTDASAPPDASSPSRLHLFLLPPSLAASLLPFEAITAESF